MSAVTGKRKGTEAAAGIGGGGLAGYLAARIWPELDAVGISFIASSAAALVTSGASMIRRLATAYDSKLLKALMGIALVFVFCGPAWGDGTVDGKVIRIAQHSAYDTPVVDVLETDRFRSGPYLQGGLAVGWIPDLDREATVDPAVDPFVRRIQEGLDLRLKRNVDVQFGLDARAGYRWGPWIASEFQFQYLPNTSIQFGGLELGKLDSYLFGVNAKLYPLPLFRTSIFSGRLQPYLLAGIGGRQDNFTSNNDLGFDEDCLTFMGRVGLGLDAYVTDSIFLYAGADYIIPTGKADDVGLDQAVANFGVGYRW